jgi:hypothetical protein
VQELAKTLSLVLPWKKVAELRAASNKATESSSVATPSVAPPTGAQ